VSMHVCMCMDVCIYVCMCVCLCVCACDATAEQLRNVSLYNFSTPEHFPDNASCINFSQSFGLCPTEQR